MPDAYSGPLIIWKSGKLDAEPVIMLHDRFQDQDELKVQSEPLDAHYRVVRVRGARTQMEDTYIKGYYWFFGPLERPELSTFGDGLFHLETLALHLAEHSPSGKVSLVGKGEGGVLALMLAMVWPERIRRVVCWDGPLPENRDTFPLVLQPGQGLPLLLVSQNRDLSATAAALSENGWAVNVSDAPDTIAKFLIEA